MQSINASKYEENLGLYGPALISMCLGDVTSQHPSHSASGKSDFEDGGLWFEIFWFYIGFGIGFNSAFLDIFGILLLNTSWRRAYFWLKCKIRVWPYVANCIK